MMQLRDFSAMLGIDGVDVKEEECCCIKHAANKPFVKNGVAELKYGGEAGEKLFDCFNSIQGDGNMGKQMNRHRYVLSFVSEGTLARFYRLYEVTEKITYTEAKRRHLIPDDYKERIEGEDWSISPDTAFYVLNKKATPGDLERRLLVKFPPIAFAVGFSAAGKNEVTQVEPLKIATEFTDYKSVYLTYRELKHVVQDDIWKQMLSRFGGVYLIHDDNTGMNYVGSAYSKGGILNRWKNYAENPTGGTDEEGNAKLVELLRSKPRYAEEHFHYSILEVLPLSTKDTNQDILDAETRWKVHLGTRTRGLNAN